MARDSKWTSKYPVLLLFLYILIVASWILLTDHLFQVQTTDLETVYLWLSFKDWFFIIVSGLVFVYLAGGKSRMKGELTKSEQQYHRLFENSLDGIMLTNPNGDILRVNPAGCRILGMDEEEIKALGRDGLVLKDEKLKNAVEKRDKTGSFTGELTFIHKSGKQIPVELTTSVYKNDNGEQRTSLIFRDMTERKEHDQLLEEQVQMRTAVMEVGAKAMEAEGLEEFYELLVQKITDFLQAQEVCLVEYIGPSAIRILVGSNNREMDSIELDENASSRLKSMNTPQILELDSLKFITEHITDEPFSIGVVIPGESDPFGILILHFSKKYELSTSNRLFLKAVAHLIGITVARKKAERELQKSLNEKNTLLSEIHHRIKNNLAVISGLLEIQASEVDDENVLYALQDSQRRIHTIASIHEKLYRSKSLSNVGFERFVEDLLSSIYSTHHSKGKHQVTFQTDIENVDLEMDHAIPLGLILNELIINAYKHAFQNQENGVIRIEFTRINNTVSLRVSDNGRGLPDKFDMQQNTSLGMKIIQTLTLQLNGELTYKNLDQGCEFMVTAQLV